MAKAAFIISRVLGPIPLLIVLWLVTAVKSGIGFWRAIWVYPLILLIALAIPTAITTYLIAVKKVSDIEWKRISDRRKYLFPLSIFPVFFLSLLTYLLTNQTIFHLTLLFNSIIVVMMMIYSFSNFKVSAHIAILTVTIATVNLFYHLNYLWLFLLIIPVVWARYILKIHTLRELAAGFLIPIIIMATGILLFGWPQVP